MNDKRALLGELSIDESEREGNSRATALIIPLIGTVVLAVAAWFFLVPNAPPLAISTAKAMPAVGMNSTSAGAVLDASGYVTARRQATVSSKYTGKVTDVYIEEGVLVEAGALLAKLDDSMQRAQVALSKAQLQAAQRRLDEVKVNLIEAQLEYRRAVQLAARQLASEADLDRTRLAVQALEARLNALDSEIEVSERSLKIQQQQLDDTEIRAPFGGVVIAKAAQPGEMISPVSAGGGFTRTGICTIVDMSSLEIEVDVNESYINRVTPEQPVTATLNSYPDWEIAARVITIIPTADRNKATVRVRIAFLQSDPRILPDMGVKVSFLDETAGNEPSVSLTGVLVPTSAVTSVDDESVVFVFANDQIEQRPVRVGIRVGSNRNIVSGLTPGEVVVAGLSAELIDGLRSGRSVTSQ